MLWLFMERVECMCGADIARDMVRDYIGIMPLSVEGSSEATEISLTLSGIYGITDGVGVPLIDAGDKSEGLETGTE